MIVYIRINCDLNGYFFFRLKVHNQLQLYVMSLLPHQFDASNHIISFFFRNLNSANEISEYLGMKSTDSILWFFCNLSISYGYARINDHYLRENDDARFILSCLECQAKVNFGV